jgi:hypothetical protein
VILLDISKEIAADNIVEDKKENIENNTANPVPIKESPAPVIKEQKSETNDLFVVKKKKKTTKRQKNLWLKEDNIAMLEEFSKKYDFNEGEIVDILIENYLKLMKVK